MSQTYHARLRGNLLEWEGASPPAVSADHAIPVEVTLLDDAIDTVSDAPGASMAAILSRLAALPAFGDIADAATWQRQVRKDRRLPGRKG